jgi:hypothetical protein
VSASLWNLRARCSDEDDRAGRVVQRRSSNQDPLVILDRSLWAAAAPPGATPRCGVTLRKPPSDQGTAEAGQSQPTDDHAHHDEASG